MARSGAACDAIFPTDGKSPAPVVVGLNVDIRATDSTTGGPDALTSQFIMRRDFAEVVRMVWAGILKDECVDLAAQMSFYFTLALFPFFIVIAAVVGWLPSTNIWHNLAQWVTDYFPSQSRQLVFATILELTRGSNGFLSLGIAATLWTASSGFVSLMESLTVAYGSSDTRTFVQKRMIAIAATFVGAIFLIASFGMLAFGHWIAILFHLGQIITLPVPWEFARWLASLLIMFIALDLINYFLPDVKRPWRWLTPGTVFVALTEVATSDAFNFYLRHFSSYPRFYGTMAVFIIVMTWIYINSLILLVGAEMDSVLEKLKRRGAVA